METLVGILVLVTTGRDRGRALRSVDRRERRHGLEIQRQIALTDAIHDAARRRRGARSPARRRGWRIGVAVPFERPAVVDAVLASVHQEFGRAADFHVVLSRQTLPAPAAKASRAVPHGGGVAVMDMNEYLIGKLVGLRLSELHAAAREPIWSGAQRRHGSPCGSRSVWR